MTTQHPSASRTRLPILMAAWLFIIAATVTMSSGLPGVVQAQAERGAIPSLNLASNAPGQLIITWETPDPAPTDYRLTWAPTSENFLSYRDDNETQRGNLYPLGDVTTLTLNNLTPGDSYKVQMRSGYYNADRSVRESSGPWTNTATQRVKDHPPAAPTGLIAARIGHSVLTLTWDDPQDDTITGYRILRGTEADNLAVINSDTASNATEYEDDTVAPETASHYAVLARSANGEGAQSDIISATTPAAPKSKEQPRRSGTRQDTPIPPVILVSNLSQTANQNATYSRDHGQAFTTGSNSTGYSVTSVTIVSKDPNNDAIPLQICEVDGSVHPTTVCTDLTPPSSYPQGNLTYTAPTSPVLTLDADTTYMLVFKAPSSPTELRVAATSSDDQDATSLTGFSIANVFQWYNTSNIWVIANGGNAIRITITGVVNPTPATGAPTISGLLEAGQTLTASTTGIAAPNGLPSTFNYQWKRYAADGTTFEADIGTDASTYTLTAAEEGKKVLVEVSFTDNAGNSEGPLASAKTLPIITASVVLVSNTAQGNDTNTTYSANSMLGQAFTAGNNPTGYTFTSVTINSEDAQGDDLALELCEVGTDGNTPENCTVLTPPASFTSGPLFFYAPTGSTLTLSNGSTHMVVFKSPGGQPVTVDGTNSNGEDASSLHNWSIQDQAHFKGPDSWSPSSRGTVFRIGIRGIVNPTAPGAPTDLSATARGSAEINLSWTAPDSSGITGYKIESSSDAGSNWTDLVADTGNTNTAYQHTGLSSGDTRHYRVFAINSVGTSAPSNTANATTATVTDTTAPTVTSITRQDPTSSPTNSDTLTWRVTFSEAVESVDPGDFMVTGTTATLTVTAITSMTDVYDVTASGGNLDNLDGTVTLAFAGNQNIADPENNTLTATTPTGANDPTFELDNTVPTFVSGTANGTLIVMTFSEELDPNSLPQASSFTISALSSLSVPEPVANSVSIEGAMVTLTVAPAFITDHIVQVYNNAHQGAGGVPLQDAAGNAVQPAASVGSYSVTNETPIGPPASLRAEAGDGRVRLVWTGPAGTSQPVLYEYRQAAGASVPVNTVWSGPTLDAFQTTVLLFGLTNGTPHSFEVRAVHGSEAGAAATVSATPLAAVCNTPDLGDRREVWSTTLTVGRVTGDGQADAGYRRGRYASLGQNGDSFIIGGASYTIKDIFTIVRSDGFRRQLFLELVDDRRFTPAAKEALRFHWCSDSSGFDDPAPAGYRASNPNKADWSLYDTRELALSLAANTDTTAPTVTSITRQDPTSSPTNSDTLTWRVTFSEAVESVDPGDFMVTGTTATLTVTAVTSMTGVYDVTASGGDLDSLDATVTLTFAANQNIVDPSDNTLTATTPTGANDPTFELDNTVPTFVSGTANGTLIVMTFSEELDPNSLPPGEAFDVSALGDFSTPQPVVNSVSIEGTMVTLTVTPAIFTDHTVTVSNNAYDDGMGRVPLKDFAGNAVQPAATVGSYSVTNETPIGPPASLRAEAGDGRVRLVWTGPAGVDFQTANYQYRYAAGTSVPVDTVWSGPTLDIFQTTALLFGLTNGTPHAFEVRAIRGSEAGAAATVSATPLAAVCSTPDLGDRREVWSATLTVGRVTDDGQASAGYRRGWFGSLSQDGDSFMIGGASYTIRDLHTVVRGDGVRRRISLELVDSRRFTPAVKEALRFHWCSDSSGLTNPTLAGYRASNPNNADWSLYDTREIALSLPANNDATGTPDITGRALAGQTLTAGTGNTADADGLPQNASDFAWQWIRAADETDTPIQNATSSTYTLTDDDAGKQVKVVMSFTDSLSGVESLTSDAYPSSSTVQRVLVSNIGQTVITENNNAGELAALDAAQEFTTGSNETGYTLSSIDLELTVASTSNFPVVKLFSGSANGTEVATLTAPTNASTEKTTYTFTVPTSIALEGDTSYWVMAETGGGTWHTVGFAEDATPAPGWSIADGDEFRVRTSTGPFTTDTLVLSQLGFGNCLRKRLRLLPYLRSVDAGGWQPWDGNGMWSG